MHDTGRRLSAKVTAARDNFTRFFFSRRREREIFGVFWRRKKPLRRANNTRRFRHAVRAARRRARSLEPRQAARRTRRADRRGPRAGRRHQLRVEQRAASDGLRGRTRRRGVPRTPRPARGRGHPVGQPQVSRPSARRHRRPRRPQSRHSP